MTTADSGKQEARELLPWYLNRTLDAAEAERVRAHVAGSEALRAEADDVDALLKALGEDVPVPMLDHARIDRVMARLDDEPQAAKPVAGTVDRFLAAFRAGRSFDFLRPAPLALAAALALIAVVVLLPQPVSQQGDYVTLYEDRPPIPITVRFEEGVTIPDAQSLLEDLSLNAARQPDGAYRVELPEGTSPTELYRVLEVLRADGRVASARAATEED